jgi:hypothetical protein
VRRVDVPAPVLIETRSALPEARLAAAVIRTALEDATAGDEGARAWLTRPRSLAPWAALLKVEPELVVELAASCLPGLPSRP